MRVLFAGPTLYGLALDTTGLDVRPPAAQGDLARAVLAGATAIGLVDGLQESVAAIWHKEILFALSRGVPVLGAASMGAMRAAECATFGMQPVGVVAQRYLDGRLDDDAAVAQLHAPAELGFAPLTLALVDVDATLALLAAGRQIDADEHQCLAEAAAALFFKHRTLSAVVQAAYPDDPQRARHLAALYATNAISLKQRDACQLVGILRAGTWARSTRAPSWELAETQTWLAWRTAQRPAATLVDGA